VWLQRLEALAMAPAGAARHAVELEKL
jgi:hypothetical protein